VHACKLATTGILVELYHHVGALTEKKKGKPKEQTSQYTAS
jgi:hypothetical protein